MKGLRIFSRIFVGLVLIYSGFVKGIDPLGSTYKFEDYFIAFNIDFLNPLALYLAMILCAVEFVAGIALVFGIKIKPMSFLVLIFMTFFTVLTLILAIFDPVPDCGCFGDAIILTNWETFYKNLFLMFFVLIIFFNRTKFIKILSNKDQYIILTLSTVVLLGISIYSYQHLPLIDFRPWEIGNNMKPDNSGGPKIYLTFKNKKTGKEKEYISPDYPWKDSVWMSEWEFIDQRIDDSHIKKGHNLTIEDLDGNDVTENFIYNHDYQFLLIAYELSETDKAAFKEINKFFEQCDADGFSLIVLTNGLLNEINDFKKDLNPKLEFYNADDIVLKTMVRSNPGLLLMKDGIVLNKWHYNDFPTYKEFLEEYVED